MYSNYNVNKNHPTYNMSDNGYRYYTGAVKLRSPKWSRHRLPVQRCSPTRTPNVSNYCKEASCKTAAADPANYYDMFLPAHNRRCEGGQSSHKHTECCSNYHQQRLAQYNMLSQGRKNCSPPLYEAHQQKGNRLPRNSHSKQHHHHHKKSQPPDVQRQYSKSSDTATNNLTTDQHYQHYYSYYYQRQPEPRSGNRQSSRKIISKIMASAKKSLASEIPEDSAAEQRHKPPRESNNYEANNYMDTANNSQYSYYNKANVLKEKMPNNNIINQFDNSEWIGQMADNEFLNTGKEFIDVKEVDDYLHEIQFAKADEYGSRSRATYHIKRRLQAQNSPYDPDGDTNTWIEVSVNNNCQSEEHKYLVDSDTTIAAQRQPATLPTTPVKAKGAVITSKKHSPPAHRVLLYGSQSPRLLRLSPSTFRVQDQRKMHVKSPSGAAKQKQIDCNNTDPFKIDARILKPINCLQPNLVRTNNEAPKQRGEAVHQADNGNQDDNPNDDDDDDDDDDLADDVSALAPDSCESDISSDSEDGYRSYAFKLTHSLDRNCMTPSYMTSTGSSQDNLSNPNSLLVPSLFPNVPPYLAFSSNTKKGPDVPPELYRILKWRVTSVMPKVVRAVLANSGMRMLKKTNDWMGTWGKHMKSPCFKTIRPYQKINHLPGSFKIGRKDSCWKNLQKQMNKHGKKDFGFMPKTYIIPHDLNMLRKNWPRYAQRNVKWIIKPPASARGAGIRVVDRWAQIPKRRPLIVQKYIERPLLINGSKFDLRLYVLVTSINPLRVFMYHNGLARFASVKYSDKSDTLNDRCMHLTNYSINKFSSNYSKNEDFNACHGHKWTIKSLWTYLANRGIRTDFLWEALRNLVLRTIIAGEQSINNMIKMNVESRYSCFELFGFDVLLDADLIPWLLEVNISPSLHSELPLDAHVKAPLVQGVLNTALFHVPPKLSLDRQKDIAASMSLPPGPICYDKRMYINYLSRAEKIKHNTFTRKTMEDRDEYVNLILENLTPDDLRCLIVAEDELARSAPLERIFPTSQTYKYLKYTESPRYYNRLLDAWEARYGNNRSEGIALLREFCEDKYHLEIPPSPAKKRITYRTRAIVVKCRRSKWGLSTVAYTATRWTTRSILSRTPQIRPKLLTDEHEASAEEEEEELQQQQQQQQEDNKNKEEAMQHMVAEGEENIVSEGSDSFDGQTSAPPDSVEGFNCVFQKD